MFQITAKRVHIFMSLALTAFLVATIVLAVQNSNLTDELNDVKDKLDLYESQLEGELKPKEKRSIILQEKEDKIDYRLPSNMVPEEYDLYLHPDLETGSFTGQETIKVKVLTATKQIILHSHKLDIQSVYVSDSNSRNFEVESYEPDSKREFLIISMTEEIMADQTIKLGIIFQGQMQDKIVGLYSSSYLTPDNEKRTIATSKFEPTYARQAFPCFDEPAMKAIFKVTLIHPTGDGYHALSNMNEVESQLMGQYTQVTFADSVPMSTYVTCFIVSDLESKSDVVHANGIGDDFNIRVFATKHQIEKVDFALTTGIKVTEYYIQYFQTEYPLPKLDMAAIPDFVSNAMEHWGLLTYRETALLYDPTISSTYNKQRVAAVVAHELAHMWFGNLVTMKWWNDLWLNEGFARFLQYKGVNEAYPDWLMNEIFLIEVIHSVMKFDARTSSHPIIQTVETPDEITEVFDTISYEKGASVIRMVENLVGADQFREAVKNYLTTYKYSNAETNDFISELEALGIVNLDIRQLMRTWTEQMGYPVINVTRETEYWYRVTQMRFFSNSEDYDLVFNDSPFNYKWDIPLTFTFDNTNAESSMMLFHDTDFAAIAVVETTKWIKLNLEQVGYYRVNYDEITWNAIINDLKADPSVFSVSDRANLLDDSFALADAGQLNYDVPLDMMTYLENENSFVPWSVAATKLQDLSRRLSATESITNYFQYSRSLISKVYNEVTWEVDADNHQRNRLRVSILTAACSLGLPDCLKEASSRFSSWLLDPSNSPAPDLREIIYYFGMQTLNDAKLWDQMWNLFINEQDASEKLKLMYGLSAIREPWLLHRFAVLAADESYVRRQDYFTCLQNIAQNPVGEAVIWDYVREQWPTLVDRFTLNERYLGRMIPSITGHFSTQVRLEEMQNFFEKYPEAGAGAAARLQAIETVKYNIKWLKENSGEINTWLQDFQA